MDDLGKQFGKIVKQRLKALNANPYAIESSAGLPADAIRNVIRSEKKSGPTLSRVHEICNALGLELYIGPPRDTDAIELVTLDSREYARVPIHEIELAAGTGAENHGEAIMDHLAFRREWLNRIGVSASNARLAHVRGDSMLPTLRDRDLVMIDTAQVKVAVRSRSSGGKLRADLYAIVENGMARVKRVEHSTPGMLVLHSDNISDYPPEVLTGHHASELQVIGKVVWWGHTVR